MGIFSKRRRLSLPYVDVVARSVRKEKEDRKGIKYGGGEGDLTELNDREPGSGPPIIRSECICHLRRSAIHKKATIMREKTLDWGKKSARKKVVKKASVLQSVSYTRSQLVRRARTE